MPAIKDPSQIAAKWANVTPQRTGEYAAGVASPRTPWAAATVAANDRYKEGVLGAIKTDRFAVGVRRAGDAAYTAGATNKGPARFAEGVAMSAPAYQAGFAPYAQIISNTQLPPRFARGDPRNIERVRVMSAALRSGKTR